LQAGAKKNDREFYFDIRHWVMSSQRLASHTCLFPTTGRFGSSSGLPLPRQGTTLTIIGFICQPAIVTVGEQAVKRLIVEIRDIAFVGPDSAAPRSSPVKGV
jgi:hypothetical protein